MKLFRYYKEISTNYTDTELLIKLNSNIEIGEPTNIYGGEKPELPFRGIIKNNSFKISRTFRGRNMLLPLIIGNVEKCRITLDFVVFPDLKIFSYILGLIFNILIMIVLLSLNKYMGLLVFISSEIILLIIMQVNFWIEYRRSFKELENIINKH